jgi:hypothetical protein
MDPPRATPPHQREKFFSHDVPPGFELWRLREETPDENRRYLRDDATQHDALAASKSS